MGSSNDLGMSQEPELVRCNSCRAAISSALVRCSYCGQITTGTERKISQFDLDYQRKERAAERRAGKNQCKVCGKTIPAKTDLCSKCEARDRTKQRLIFALLVVAVVAIVYWFAR